MQELKPTPEVQCCGPFCPFVLMCFDIWCMIISAAKCWCQNPCWLKQTPCLHHVMTRDDTQYDWWEQYTLRDILGTNGLVSHFVMIFLNCDQFYSDIFMTNSGLKQNNVSLTSSTVMMMGETQTVMATITSLVTLCATNYWSVTWWRHFQSVIITIVVGDMRCERVIPINKMSMVSRSV